MKYGIFYSHDLKNQVKQINVRTAKKLFEMGKNIFLQSSNINFDNVWQKACEISKDRLTYNETFDTVCNAYMYYNCDSERGKYINYFVRVQDCK
jgi:hypothetical protein